MADREDFATAVGGLIKGRVPAARLLTSGEDVLALSGGVYVTTDAIASSLTNVPEAVGGVYVVEGGAPGAVQKSVRFIPHREMHEWENRMRTLVAWRGWRRKESAPDRGARGTLAADTDIDAMRGEAWVGTWDTPGAGAALDSLGGTWPLIGGERIPRLAIITVSGTLSQLRNMGYQTMALLASGSLAETRYYIRFNQGYNREGPEAWTDWTRLDTPDFTEDVQALDIRVASLEEGGGGVPVNALATGGRAMREQLFREQYPLVSTRGKGVVVFRYDHGLTNFRDVLYPLHRQYDIPAYIAMNSRLWDIAENSGASQAEARSWVGVEWGNHTADHEDKTGIADIHDNIVNGRIELEEQLSTTIHGFTMPGVTEHDRFDGLGVGYASGYSNSYAGSLVMAHHAVVSGMVGPQYRPLDGQLHLGGRHIGWEYATFEEVKGYIDEAVATRTALTLMQHPRTMGATSFGRQYWTPDLADQVLAYVRQLIDAGDLADISYYQSHHAQLAALPTPEYRSGLRDVSGELMNGWTGTLLVEREGSDVYIRGTINGQDATSDIPWMLPSGWRPGFVGSNPVDYGTGIVWTATSTPRVYRINHYLNRLQLSGANGESSDIQINHRIRTRNAAPSSAPGDPA